MLGNIRIVLVNPLHPGNIGMAARAMKNMGLSRLFLVNPKRFPDKEAIFRASRADDVIGQAVVVHDLYEAIKDCQWVFGASARMREDSQVMFDPEQAAQKIFSIQPCQIAIIFGCETMGLTNEELSHCQYQIYIPAVNHYNSLNLAAAVQVIVYELYKNYLPEQNKLPNANKKSARGTMPTMAEMNGLFRHIEQTMIAIGFLNPERPRRLISRLKHILTRAQVDKDDIDLLRGMMTAIGKIVGN